MHKILEYLSKRSKLFLIAFSFLLVLTIGILDTLNGIAISIAVLYIIPIAILAWYVSRGAGVQVAFLSAIIWMLSDIFAEKTLPNPVISFWNTIVKIGLFVVVSVALSEIRASMESNSLLASIVDFSDDAIIGKNLAGNIISWNKGAEKIYGYKAEEVLGKTGDFLYPSERNNEFVRLLEKVNNDKRIEHYETQRIRKDGTLINVSLTISPIRDMQGNLIGVSLIARDITRQKRIEKELKSAEIRYRTLFEQSPDGILIIDPQTEEIFEFNDIACQQLGYTRKEFFNVKIADYQAELTPEQVKEKINLIIEKGHYEFESHHKTKQGLRRNRLVSGKTIDWGNKPALLIVHHDISETKQMEAELRKEKDMLETITQNMGAGVTIINSEYQTVWSNRVMKQMFGEIEGHHCFIPFYAKTKHNMPKAKLENDAEHNIYELKITDINARETWVQIIATSLKDERGEIIGGLELVIPIDERKKIEEALSKSEEKYRELINTSADGVISVNDRMQVTLWNQMAENIFGYTAQEMIGQDLFKIVPERYRAAKAKGFAEFKVTGTGPVLNKTVELYGMRKDKKEIPIELSISSRQTEEGYLVTAIVRDISERKRIEEELKYEFTINSHLAELSATLVSSSPSLEVICNLVLEKAKTLTHSEHGFAALIDPETKNLVAYTLTDMMGEQCRVKTPDQKIFFAPEPDGKYPALFGYPLNERRAFYTASPSSHPASKGVPEGHIPLKNFLSVPAILGGNLIGQIAVANSKRDYSEKDLASIRRLAVIFALSIQRKKAEEQLRESEKKYRTLVDTMQEGIMVINPGATITFVNPRMAEMLGYTIDELIGLDLMKLLNEEYQMFIKNKIEERKQGIKDQYELEMIKKDRNLINLMVSVSPVWGENGQFLGSLAGLQDLTAKRIAEDELKKTMAELTRSNRDLEHFAYIVSHDLQEPLGKITAFGDLLKLHGIAGADEKSLDYLNRMIGAAGRMKELIDGILNLSRVSTKAQTHETLDLNAVVNEVLSDLEIKIRDFKAEITVGKLPTIKAEPLQMRQLFQNLITNALKFHKPDQVPKIDIAAHQINRNLVEITVKDNGIGFEEKYLDRIFKPFQRLHSRHEYEGIGMGLAICQKIALRHGGDITAHSVPGEGTTFIITLPINQG